MLADETAHRLTISDQAITVTGPITVDNANLLAATTTGVVTGTILGSESLEELTTLDAVGDNLSIIIPDGTATASALISLSEATTAVVDASALTGLASAEVYGFHADANGHLQQTTTNGGADNISASTYAAFEQVLLTASGFSYSVNTNGNLIVTI